MLAKLKRALRSIIESRGYFVRPTSEFGFVLGHDIRRLLGDLQRPQIIDVGANAGQWLRSIKTEFPQARVVCYEPDARIFAALQRTAAEFADVECVPCALGRDAGTLTLHRNADSVTSSLLQPIVPSHDVPYASKLKPVDRAPVEVRTLSDELQRMRIDQVDLLKTDCQGFDLAVLQGGARAIEDGRVRLIATEALFHLEYEGQSWFQETLAWLNARGFSFIGLYDVMHDARGRAIFGDALFARNDAIR
ncbi:MAG: FkbM family methyltransferase [Chthoniobacterales bacterium]